MYSMNHVHCTVSCTTVYIMDTNGMYSTIIYSMYASCTVSCTTVYIMDTNGMYSTIIYSMYASCTVSCTTVYIIDTYGMTIILLHNIVNVLADAWLHYVMYTLLANITDDKIA